MTGDMSNIPIEIEKTYDLSPDQVKYLDNNFTYHPPKSDQYARYVELRQSAKSLAKDILTLTPKSREQSLALTNLEQAIFWANAAIARNE